VVVVEGSRRAPPGVAHRRRPEGRLKIVSALAGLTMIAAVIVLIATGSFIPSSPLVVACQLGAVALAVWARRSFAPGQFRASPAPAGESVIRRGPYRYVRHPMYAAALLLVWATVIGHWTPLGVALGLVVLLVAAVRIADEERRLRGRYADYAEYAQRTKALVPFVI
jgi:protein-S-isoprenylcysteine O-methyltransferase Ste14